MHERNKLSWDHGDNVASTATPSLSIQPVPLVPAQSLEFPPKTYHKKHSLALGGTRGPGRWVAGLGGLMSP